MEIEITNYIWENLQQWINFPYMALLFFSGLALLKATPLKDRYKTKLQKQKFIISIGILYGLIFVGYQWYFCELKIAILFSLKIAISFFLTILIYNYIFKFMRNFILGLVAKKR